MSAFQPIAIGAQHAAYLEKLKLGSVVSWVHVPENLARTEGPWVVMAVRVKPDAAEFTFLSYKAYEDFSKGDAWHVGDSGYPKVEMRNCVKLNGPESEAAFNAFNPSVTGNVLPEDTENVIGKIAHGKHSDIVGQVTFVHLRLENGTTVGFEALGNTTLSGDKEIPMPARAFDFAPPKAATPVP